MRGPEPVGSGCLYHGPKGPDLPCGLTLTWRAAMAGDDYLYGRPPATCDYNLPLPVAGGVGTMKLVSLAKPGTAPGATRSVCQGSGTTGAIF